VQRGHHISEITVEKRVCLESRALTKLPTIMDIYALAGKKNVKMSANETGNR
jgi:hypothetical protein